MRRWQDLSRVHVTFLVLTALAAAIAAMLLVLSVSDIPRALLEAEYGKPPSQFLTLPDGSRVHYRISGPRDAPPVILLHGFMGSLFAWDGWAPPLSDRFQVIALDLPGHGLTGTIPSNDYSQAAMAEFLLAFANKLKLNRFAIVGNSMGGDVAAHFSEVHPDRVSALILMDAAGAQTETRARLNLKGTAANILIASHLVAILPPCWLFPAAPHHWDSTSICGNSATWQMARMPGSRRAILEHYRLPPDYFVWAHAGAIKAPTLIQWGEDDRVIPIASAYAWRGAIHGSKLKSYAHSGHLVMLDAPVQSAADAKAFLLSTIGTERSK